MLDLMLLTVHYFSLHTDNGCFFLLTETRTSLLIRTQSTRELYKESQKEVVNKGDLEGSGGAPGHLN